MQQKNWRIATAESCTGGQLAEALTTIAGSSAWFDRGFVTYSNEAKQAMLGVDSEIIVKFGAVSSETVTAMAQGILQNSPVKVGIAVTGIAGPSGGTQEKPVGTVWIAWIIADLLLKVEDFHFTGDRLAIRSQATHAALLQLLPLL